MQQTSVIKKQSLGRRMVIPSLAAVMVWMVLNTSYDVFTTIQDPDLYAALTDINWILLVAVVGFSAVITYPIMYFRGASLPERLIGAMALPLAFCLKEMFRATVAVSIPEAFFYAFFTSVQLLLLVGQVGLLSLMELICRKIATSKKGANKVLTPVPTLLFPMALTALYFILIYDGGYAFHLKVKMVYRALFL